MKDGAPDSTVAQPIRPRPAATRSRAGGQTGSLYLALGSANSLYHARPLDTHMAEALKLAVRAVRREEPRQVTR